MTCQFCTEKLTWLIPSEKTLSRTGALALSIASAGTSAFLSHRVYDTSIQVFKELIPCPGIELSCMSIVVVGAAYLSLKNAHNAIESEPARRYTPRTLRPRANTSTEQKVIQQEVVAFSPGEMIGPPRGASQ